MSRFPASARPAIPTVRLRLLLAAVLIVLSMDLRVHAAGSVADLDRDNGLPDAQLGAPLSSFPGMVKTEDVGRWLTFKRPADTLRYGKYAVTDITYNFFKERLYSINLEIRGRGNIEGINKLLERNYGKDFTKETLPFAKINDTMEVREWSGTRAYCVMKNSTDEKGGVLTLLDKPTWDLLQAPKKEKLQANKALLQGSFLNGDMDRKAAATPAPAPPEAAPGVTDPQSLPGNPLLPPPKL